MIRALLVLFLALAPIAARAEERITSFDVAIEVAKSGDITVTEKIAVVSEGHRIQRGIFRDLPRFYEKNGGKLPYNYDVLSVARDGRSEPHAIETAGNALRIRIGEADVFLEDGPHAYEIAYRVKNQVRYFEGYDEIYWNVTGNYWSLPIARAAAAIRLPDGADATQHAAYTGPLGEAGRDFSYRFTGGAHAFETTRPLGVGEGLTVAVGIAKGVVDPPSAADARAEWWTRNLSRILLTLGFLGVGGFYLATFERVGRDPQKGPVFPRYEAPEGLSPAAVHHVFHRGFSGHDAFISTLVNLGVKQHIKIEAGKGKKTTLTRLAGGAETGIERFERSLEQRLLLNEGTELVFGGKYNPALTSAYQSFQKEVAKAYGAPFFRWNRWQLLLGLALSGGVVFLAVRFSVGWSLADTLAAAVLAAMGLAAAYFLPAPTEKGQKIRTEIEGFRLYLKTAEELQLNAAKVGGEEPPPMTVERYERFLPYAIALGAEKPWTRHFERLMPKEAAEYRPAWSSGSYGGGRSLSSMNSALVGAMASGVSSSLPQSSSSSGSGGGGSSGGGGGGGGGGGW
jgi:uncharacterized membrane protein YgcG